MLLGKITESYYNAGSEEAGYRRIKMNFFNKEFKNNIIKEKVNSYNYHVPEKLHGSPKLR
jgi:hypothetical protein